MTNHKEFFRHFCHYLWLPLLLGILACGGWVARNGDQRVRQLDAGAQAVLASSQVILGMAAARLQRHIQSLAGEEPILRDALARAGSAESKFVLEGTLRSLITRNPEYDQVRWVGLDGVEQLRVHRDAMHSVQVARTGDTVEPVNQEYLAIGKQLDAGAFYVSPLELARDNGKIEEPRVPVVRIVARLFDFDQNPLGLLVLVVDCTELLQQLTAPSSTDTDRYLVNDEGFSLAMPAEHVESGFMNEDSHHFASLYPLAWEDIQSANAGYLQTPNGIFRWQKVDLGRSAGGGHGRQFTLVTRVAPKAVAAIRHELLVEALLFAFLPLLFLVVSSWRRARADLLQARYLRQTERLYNTAPCGYHAYNADGVLVRINDTELSWLEYERNELLGKAHVSDILTDASVRLLEDKLPQLVERGVVRDMSMELLRRNGVPMPVLIKLDAEYDDHGHYCGALATVTDNSSALEKERAMANHELFLMSVTNNLPGMVGYWDTNLDNKMCNRNFRDWLEKNFKDSEQPEIKDLLGDNYDDYLSAALAAEDCGEPFSVEARLLGGGSGERDVILHVIPDEIDDDLQGFMIVAIDITDLKTAHNQLEQVNKALKAESARAYLASQAKSTFLANMSHEIRTPLNALLGISYILSKTRLDPEQQASVSKIQFAGKSLLAIVNDILDISKIEAGEMQVEQIPFSLPDLLVEIECLMREQAEAKGIAFASDLKIPAAVACMRGDAQKLRQISLNFLSNAIKFTERGRVCLNATAARSGEHSIRVRIAVRDTGIGIADEVREKLFQPFSQADESTTRKFGGTGLGLAICKRMAEMMGGEVGVDSEAGVGSCFWLELDLAEATAQDMREIVRNRGQSNLRILIAEDDPVQCRVLQSVAERMSWKVDTVASGEELVARLVACAGQGYAYDCLVLDWQLSDFDSIEALARVDQQVGAENLPACIIVSAYDVAALSQAESPVAIQGFIEKPVTASDLFDQVSSAVVRKSEGQVQSSPSAAAANPDGGQGALANIRILLVDDSELNLDVAGKILRMEGALVATGMNGQEALDTLNATPDYFHLVLMDIQMPVMDGLTSVRKMREDMALSIPVIALTAGALAEERARALLAGMNDFIPKPFEPEDLIQKVRQHAAASPSPVVAVSANPGDEIVPRVSGEDVSERFDFERALRRVAGDQDMLRAIVGRLLADFDAIEAPLFRDALGTERFGELSRLVHKLAGNAGLAGAPGVRNVASRLEQAFRAQETAAIEELVPQLEVEIGLFRTGYKDHRIFADLETLVETPDPTRGATELDEDSVGQLLALLESRSIDAYHYFRQQGEKFLAALQPQQFEQLENAIRSLAFDGAIALIRTWCVAKEDVL